MWKIVNDTSILVDLAQNVAILLAFSLIYDSLWLSGKLKENKRRQVLMGLILGVIGIVLMSSPWNLSQGISFDTRSVLLSASGLFFGLIPTVIAMIITAGYRLLQGGDGVIMGIAVIVTSSLIGMLWKKFRPEWNKKNYLYELLALGGLVHLFMLACVLLLPSEKMFPTFRAILLPLFIIYLPATMLLGIIMVRQRQNYINRRAKVFFTETERRYYEILNSSNLLSVLLDNQGKITYCNDHICDITDYEKEKIIGQDWFDIFLPEEQRMEIKRIFKLIVTGEIENNAYENEIVCRDGTHLYISWYNSLLKDASGEIVGTASVGFDFTKQKDIERELQSHKEKLEQVVRLRTKELLKKNKELQDFNKLFINREFRIKELKEKLKLLEEDLRINKEH